MEYTKIKLLTTDYDLIRKSLPPHEVSEVLFKDNMFEGDETHKRLKSASSKAYKQLKEYEFNKRFNR